MNTTPVRTTDIVLAAYLVSKGVTLDAVTVDGSMGSFVFNDVPSSHVEDYNKGSALVEPVTLNANIRRLATSVRQKVNGQ